MALDGFIWAYSFFSISIGGAKVADRYHFEPKSGFWVGILETILEGLRRPHAVRGWF